MMCSLRYTFAGAGAVACGIHLQGLVLWPAGAKCGCVRNFGERDFASHGGSNPKALRSQRLLLAGTPTARTEGAPGTCGVRLLDLSQPEPRGSRVLPKGPT